MSSVSRYDIYLQENVFEALMSSLCTFQLGFVNVCHKNQYSNQFESGSPKIGSLFIVRYCEYKLDFSALHKQ